MSDPQEYIDHVFTEPPFIRTFAYFAGTIKIGPRAIILPQGKYVSTGGIVTIERLFQAAREKGIFNAQFTDDDA